MDVVITPAVQAVDAKTTTHGKAIYDNDAIIALQDTTHDAEAQTRGTAVIDVEDDFPEGGREAWLVVLGAFMLLFPSFGFMVSIGTLQEYWHVHQLADYTVRDVGWIPSVFVYLALGLGIWFGPLFDRYGPRYIALVGSLSYVVMTFLLAECREYYQFLLCCGFLGGVAGASLTTTSLAAVSHWFKRRRALTQGIAMIVRFPDSTHPILLASFHEMGSFQTLSRTAAASEARFHSVNLRSTCDCIQHSVVFFALCKRYVSRADYGSQGSSFGGVAIPLILRATLPKYGYKCSIRILGLIFIVCLLLGNIFIKARLKPVLGANRKNIISLSIFGDLRFSLLTISVFGFEVVLFGALGLFPTYATVNSSYPSDTGFYLLAVMNAVSCLGRLFPGLVADRMGRFNVLLIMILVTLVLMLLIWLPFGATSLPALYIFAALFGFGTGSWMALTPACIGQLCVAEEFGRYYGTLYFVASLATLVCIPIGGELLGVVGSNALVGFFCAVLGLSSVSFALSRWACLGWRWSWREMV